MLNESNINQSNDQLNSNDQSANQINNLNQSNMQSNNVDQSNVQLNNELNPTDQLLDNNLNILEKFYNEQKFEDLLKISFEELKNQLKKLTNEDNLNKNKGIKSLIEDFIPTISKNQDRDKKIKLFNELSEEIKSNLLIKPKILMSNKELNKRRNRIKKIKVEISKLDRKIKKLEDKELDLNELENSNILDEISIKKKRVVKLYLQLREAQNKFNYLGDDHIDFQLSRLTLNQQLNELLIEKYSNDFKNSNLIPNFKVFEKLVGNFLETNGIQDDELEVNKIYKKMINTFKKLRIEKANSNLDSYLNEDELQDLLNNEPKELTEKLNKQNKFHDNLIEIEKEFLKKFSQQKQEEEEMDEETSDSETDSQDLDEIETVSSSEEEFIAKDEEDEINDDSFDNNCLNDDSIDNPINDTIKEDEIKNNSIDNCTNDKSNDKCNDNPINDTIKEEVEESSSIVNEAIINKEEIKESSSIEIKKSSKEEIIDLSTDDEEEEEIKLNQSNNSSKRKIDDQNENGLKKSKNDDDNDCIMLD